MTLALALSVASAIGYATAAVFQQRLAAGLDRSLGWLLALRHSAWWWAAVLNAAAAALHVAALRYGPLTVVQPLGMLTLVLALPIGAGLAGRRVGPKEWSGALATVAGLTGLVLLTASAVPTRTLDSGEVALVTATTTATLVLLTLLGTRTRPRVAGVLYGAAAGIAFGVASALTQTVTVDIARHGLMALTDLTAVAVAALVTAGTLLSQAGYRAGLAAPLAASTLANPVAAGLVGLVLLGERFTAGTSGALLAVAAACLAGWGVVTLFRSTPEPVASTATPPTRQESPEALKAPLAFGDQPVDPFPSRR